MNLLYTRHHSADILSSKNCLTMSETDHSLIFEKISTRYVSQKNVILILFTGRLKKIVKMPLNSYLIHLFY